MLSLEETALAIILTGAATVIVTSFALAGMSPDSRKGRALYSVFIVGEVLALSGFALLAVVGVGA